MERFHAITFVLLLRLRPMPSVNYIEPLIRCYILLIAYILRSSSLLSPHSLSLIINFSISFRLRLMLRLLITML